MAGLFVPQMVAPVSPESTGLASLGNTIGRWREESQLQDIMKDFRPDDPNSRADVIHRLGSAGIPGGRDMAERLLGTFDTLRKEEQGRREREQVRTDEINRQNNIMKILRENAGGGNVAAGLAAIPPASAAAPPELPAPTAPAATAPRAGASAAAAPTIATTSSIAGGRPRPATPAEEKQLYEPTVAAADTAAATTKQAAADLAAPQARRAQAMLATGSGGASQGTGVVPVPTGTPEQLPPPPPRPPTTAALPPGGAPAAAVPATVPPPAPAAARPPAAVAAGPPASAAPREGTLPAIGIPKEPADVQSPEEIRLRNQVNNLNIGMGLTRHPGEKDAYKAMIDSKEKDIDRLAKTRTEASEDARKARLKAQERVTEKDIDKRSVFVEESAANGQKASNLIDNLTVMHEIASQPGFLSGPEAPKLLLFGQMVLQADQALKNISGGKWDGARIMGDDKWLSKLRDSTTSLRAFQQIHNVLVQLQAGSLGGQFSTPDLRFTQAQMAQLTDDPASALKIIKMQIAQQKRIEMVSKIATDGEAEGKSYSEIRREVRDFVRNDRSFVDHNGKLTPLGREIVGDRAKIEAFESAEAARISAQAAKQPAPGAGTSQPVQGGDKGPPAATRREAAAGFGNTVLGHQLESMTTPTRDYSRNLNRGGYQGPGAPLPSAPPPSYDGPGAPLPAQPDYSGPGAPLPPIPEYSGPGAPLPVPPPGFREGPRAPFFPPQPLPAPPTPRVPQQVSPTQPLPQRPGMAERIDEWIRSRANSEGVLPGLPGTTLPPPLEPVATRRGRALEEERRRRGLR